MCSVDIFLGFLAILFPPLPVWVKRGICSVDSVINILLLMLGYIPGLIHAWYIIAKFPEPPYEYDVVPGQDSERGRVTYIFVHTPPPQSQPQYKPQGPDNVNYGTTSHPGQSSNSRGPQAQTQAQPPHDPQGHEDAGEGGSNGPAPPSYAQVVAGDHKVQDQA
ncbi:hypothetical protein SODALDRAFT_318924 [Sodiomyces alkalinus F11]|uniref:Uncharacterized protein n=1 Tax=Sodiomyces alkalinus (strain CBS 110278 / VKM F-3762 / F11) TaxID=1314773 RepID=A0A3N2Q5X6_SODAK|nr:hypothetical protein SODALDRAFT_318924 [Sodiomyces alkalinus F11]ROT42184.1 hypothetical protein SODALDRAFT_318924 [Sodiomyces alkalinus F11]